MFKNELPKPAPNEDIANTRPESLPIIFKSQTLDADSIDTLPCDLSISPGEGAEDDVIFDRTFEPSDGLPGILEEVEENEETAVTVVMPDIAAESVSEPLVSTSVDKLLSESTPIALVEIPCPENLFCPCETTDISSLNASDVMLKEESLLSTAEFGTTDDHKNAPQEINLLQPALLTVDTTEGSTNVDISLAETLDQSIESASPVLNDKSDVSTSPEVVKTIDDNTTPVEDKPLNLGQVSDGNIENEDSPSASQIIIEESLESLPVEIEKTAVERIEPVGSELSNEEDTNNIGSVELKNDSDPSEEQNIPFDPKTTLSLGSENNSAFVPYKPISQDTTPEEVEKNNQWRRHPSIDETKEKKGVLVKFLEFVGVKKKEEIEGSSSVFYCESPSRSDTAEDGVSPPSVVTPVSKKKSPSPRLVLPMTPDTSITEPTPPVNDQEGSATTSPGQKKTAVSSEVDANTRCKTVKCLSVENVILDTPPVVDKSPPILDKPKEASVESSTQIDRDSVRAVIDDILVQARLIAEDQQESEPEPIYSNVVKKASKIVIDEPPPPPPPTNRLQEFEELKVTTSEDRKKVSDKPSSSKLSSQILKAIPPPRRKAISEAKAEVHDVNVVIEKPIRVVGQRPGSRSPNSARETPVSSNEGDNSQLNLTPPPVPPRRNRSKQRSSATAPSQPQPPPKRKPKK